MHPSKFFDECDLRVGIGTFEIFDADLKEKLKSVHPENLLSTKLILPVYQINISYTTEKGNYRTADKYMIMNSEKDNAYFNFWLDMFVNDYNDNHPKHRMNNPNINSVKKICEAVLPIG